MEKEKALIDAADATRILGSVFEEAGVEPNTVPMQALTAYSSYRRERFVLLKTALVIAMILFLLLPFMFIPPRYEVTKTDMGDRKLPVYSVDVKSLLPVRSVVASMDGRPLPVYEEDRKHYTIEPTSNQLHAKGFWNFCFKITAPLGMAMILLGQIDGFFGLGIFS